MLPEVFLTFCCNALVFMTDHILEVSRIIYLLACSSRKKSEALACSLESLIIMSLQGFGEEKKQDIEMIEWDPSPHLSFRAQTFKY